MPPIEHMDMTETAVLWTKTGETRYSDPLVASPQEVAARWEKTARDAAGPNGSTLTLDASVALKVNVPDGSILYLGQLSDLTGTGTGTGDYPADGTPLYVVVTRDEAYDLKGRVVRHEYGLQRYRGTLPGVV